jgi:hypothetical protein
MKNERTMQQTQSLVCSDQKREATQSSDYVMLHATNNKLGVTFSGLHCRLSECAVTSFVLSLDNKTAKQQGGNQRHPALLERPNQNA